MTTLRIGTRGSQLALWQANAVSRLLAERTGAACELVIIRTSGDEPPNAPSGPSGGKSLAAEGPPVPPSNELAKRASLTNAVRPTREASPLSSAKATFVKEIEDALLDGRVDLAVHSSKDLLGGVSRRTDHRCRARPRGSA